MQHLGAKKPRQLAIAVGWDDMDGEKRARRIVDGESDARLGTLLPLLIAGPIPSPERSRARPAASPTRQNRDPESRRGACRRTT